MSELESSLSQFDLSVQDTVAQQHERVKAVEERRGFPLIRDLGAYMHELDGLKGFLDYVRSNVGSNTIVDIGAGDGVAINQLATDRAGKGLNFMATGLIKPEGYDRRYKVPYSEIPAETMDGIADNSLGGILACYSITYSTSPRLVTNALYRKLVSGGAIKASFIPAHWDSGFPTSSSEDFYPHFTQNGFDVAKKGNLLLAIKSTSSVSAGTLLERDSTSLVRSKVRPVPLRHPYVKIATDKV